VRQEAHKTLDGLGAESTFDLRYEFFEPVARCTAERIFGFPDERRPELMEVSFGEKGMLNLRNKVSYLIRHGENATKGSYLQGIITACKNGHLNELELASNLTFFVSLTFEAIAAPFLGGVFAMLRDLSQWDACLKDRTLLPNAVSEMLRCYPNGDGQFLRIAIDDTVLSGVTIRSGDAVLAPAPAANIDPDVFLAPRQFNVRRWNSNKHVAFGVGPHHCLGSFLVETWMRTALSTLLEHFPSLRLAVAPTAVRYQRMPLIKVMEGLPVRVER
jgi:nocardicin N-oxygenase